MERRRYVPRTEGLEGRELLSALGAATPGRSAVSLAQEVNPPSTATDLDPVTFQSGLSSAVQERLVDASTRLRARTDPGDPNLGPLRNFRIDRLPTLLNSINNGRYIPPELVEALQDDLRNLAGSLSPVPSNALYTFNLQLRSLLGQTSISVQDAQAINRLFGMVLERAGAEPADIVRFQSNMNELTQVNIAQPRAAQVTANDYGLMLQLSLAVGIDIQSLPSRAPRATIDTLNGFLGR